MYLALIYYSVNDYGLHDKFKSLRREIDNFYYDLDKEILCRIVTSEIKRNQTSINSVLPHKFVTPDFEFFHSDKGGHLGITKAFHKLKQNLFLFRRP
jgi:hypothetical protein